MWSDKTRFNREIEFFLEIKFPEFLNIGANFHQLQSNYLGIEYFLFDSYRHSIEFLMLKLLSLQEFLK